MAPSQQGDDGILRKPPQHFTDFYARIFVARANRVTQRIFGTVHAVDVPPRGDAAKAISLQIRRHETGRVREEWLSVAKPLKARVRELAKVPESLVAQTFEFVIDEAGKITAMRRISA